MNIWKKYSNSPIAKEKTITWLILILLITIGCYLRIDDMGYKSLYHDEINMLQYVQGLLEGEYPHKHIGAIKKYLTTYELLPYPIALSIIIFGFNDFAAKLPSLFFSTLTVFLIFFVGRKIFNKWVGFFAALIYTFHPQSIIWAQKIWHPQQVQFFALLTSYFIYKAFESELVNKKYIYLATLAFIATYLSWEGTGFLLPSLFFAIIALKGKNFNWIKNKDVWYAFLIIITTIFIQFFFRMFLKEIYLIVGKGLSNVGIFNLFFLDDMYDPLTYFKKFLWIENNAILTIVFLFGIPLMYKNSALRYYYVILISVLFFMTNFFPHSTYRYSHYLEVFLILSTSAVCVHVINQILQIANRRHLWTFSIIKRTVAILLLVIVFLHTNTFILKPYRVFRNPKNYPLALTRLGVPYIDYRSSAFFMKPLLKDDDIIISIQPYTFFYYAGQRSDYFMETYSVFQTVYDVSGKTPGLLGKYMGTPVIRNYDEFMDILNKNNRVWIMATPETVFNTINNNKVIEFIQRKTKVVYASYNAKVYLWEK